MPLVASVGAVEKDGIYYDLNNEAKTATVVSGDYSGLESVTIPASITIDGIDYKVNAIGDNAFHSVGMTSLTLPNTLKSIGNSAFDNCYQLASLIIPEGVETIGQSAFLTCFRLQRLELPSTLVSIGGGAFSHCSVLNVVISHMANPIQVEDNIFMSSFWDDVSQTSYSTPSPATLYVPIGSKSKYEAITGWTKFSKIEEGEVQEATVDGLNYYYATGSKTATVIPGDYKGLESVTIPAGINVDGVDYKVTAVAGYSFESCTNIKSVTIDAPLETIGNNAFRSVGMTSLSLPNSLISIGENSFGNCFQLTSLVIPEGVETIGERAFSESFELQRLELPSTLTKIGTNIISGCTSLSALVSHMSDPIQVGEHAFENVNWDNSAQTNVYTPSSATLYVPIGSKSKYVAIPGWTKFAMIEEGEVKEAVVDGLNYRCSTGSKTATVISGDYISLESITIPTSITVDGIEYKVTAIAGKTFYNCYNTKIVTINADLESIGDNAFASCQKLTSMTIPEGVEAIGQSAFENCSQIQHLELPSTLVSIGDEAFSNCSSLNVVISRMANPIQVGEQTFMIRKWDESSQSTNWTPSSATLYIPVGSRSKYEAISGWTKFSKIIEEAVVDGLTYNCSSDSKTATVISGDYKDLENVTIPASITIDGIDYKVIAISENAFKSSGKLTSLVIPEGVETIGDHAFEGCSSLLRLELPSTLVSIGDKAFAKLRSLNAVVSRMSNPIQVEEHTFMISKYDNSSQTYIWNPSPATLYVPVGSKSKYEAISGWTKFAKIEEDEANGAVVDGLNYIYATGSKTATVVDGDYSGLEHVTIPASITVEGVDYKVTAIGSEAFGGCRNIKSITINAALETIGSYAFGSASVTELVLPSSLMSIGDYAFSSCDQLTSLVIPEGVEVIGDGAFSSCGLQRLWLPSTLVSIGKEAFSRSTRLNAISSRMTTPIQVGEHAFLFPFREADGETISWVSLYTTLCVPLGSKSKYEAIPGWSKYKKIEEGELIVKDGLNYCYSTDSKTAKFIFSGYPDLKNITIPASITVDGIDYNVTAIGENVFANSSELTSVVIPEGVETIGDRAFEGCSSLLRLELPSTLVSIGEETFSNCSSLNVVVSRMTNPIQVGEHTFMISKYDNSSQTYIWNPSPATLYVPADSKSKYEAIAGWTKFTEIEEGEVIVVNVLNYGYSTDSKTATLVSGDYSSIESVTIPAYITVDGQSYEVTAIGGCAFQNNELVVKVTIPETIASIGDKAFAGCTNLKAIYIYVKTPINLPGAAASRTRGDGGSSVFAGVNTETCVLYVPDGSGDAYRNADGWKEFKNIIEMGEPESIKISSAKQVTYMSDKDLDFTGYSDLKAYVATGYDKVSGTIWLTRVKEIPAMTGFLLMGEAGTYDIPVKVGKASSYYMNLFKGTIEGTTIQTTDGDNTNYYLSNGDAGVGFYKVTKEGGVSLAANRAYLSVPSDIPAVGSEGGTETIKVSSAGQVPYYNSQSLDFSSLDAQGVKAYTATGYDYNSGTIWLTRVKQVPAETGILVMAPEGNYSVPTTSVASVYANMFKGTLTGTTIQAHETIAGVDYINYYLSNGNFGVGFYKVTKEEGVTIGANRCYLPIKNKDAVAGTRSMSDDVFFSKMITNDDDDVIAIPVFGEGTTGIISTQFQNANQDVYYNLQGQRVENPGKGLYIRNGKKVVIK